MQVEDVQRQVQEWKKSGCRQPMCTGRSGDKSITMQRLMYKDRMYKINIDMSDILDIDIKEGYVRVEPYVTVGKLNDFLISRGWTLPVVPELDDLTIGGKSLILKDQSFLKWHIALLLKYVFHLIRTCHGRRNRIDKSQIRILPFQCLSSI